MSDPARQLEGFLDKFAPEVAAKARDALKRMRKRLPGAIECVYDNYNALAIGFSGSEKASDFIFSIAVYPKYPSLFFADGADLPDPHGVLEGTGGRMRHIKLLDPALIGSPPVEGLIGEALRRAKMPIDPKAKRRVVIKSISAKQRPRR